MPTRGDARQRGRPPFTPSRQRVHRVRVSARRRGGNTDEYLGPSRTPSTRRVERRLPRVSRRSPHLELDALLAHEEVDVARRRPRRRPVAARLPRRRWGARRRHRRRRGDAAEAPRRLADPVLDALEVRAQARLCCVCLLRYGDRRPLGVAIVSSRRRRQRRRCSTDGGAVAPAFAAPAALTPAVDVDRLSREPREPTRRECYTRDRVSLSPTV